MSCIGRKPADGSKVKYDDFYACETWSLDISVAQFILPRLEYYNEHKSNNFVVEESWPEDYKEMKEGLEIIANEDACILVPGSVEENKVNRALDLLREYFLTLWL